ncbi:Carboxy-terminal processing protease CtpA [Planctomycetales bacterium 10988]|nr:Carboxy-terminal processing protease CtpA [Planctomycetales bacterium 10988]
MPVRNIYALIFVILGSLVCYQRTDWANGESNTQALKTFRRAMRFVQQDYVQDIDSEALLEGALRGMVEELDEYSAYYDPEEYQILQESLNQEFGGIGIQVSLDQETEELMVLSPMVGTPAYDAGVLAGDKILAIDGTPTKGLSLEEAVHHMRGKRGEPVVLTILHPDKKKPVDLTIVRDLIQVETVQGDHHEPDGTWNYFLEGTDRIGYIRLTSFGERTDQELRIAVRWLLEREMQGLILDLRNDPGGLLRTAVDVCDLFIQEGAIVSTRGKDGVTLRTFEASEAGTVPDFPMVILINHFTASASEIVSACLQDHKRAIIVGERSWGKGSVQNVINLRPDTDALKITTATYWRPSGRNIHRWQDSTEEDEWGVSPDPEGEIKITIEETRDLLRYWRDRDIIRSPESDSEEELVPPLDADKQLQRAYELLQEQISKPVQPAKAAA